MIIFVVALALFFNRNIVINGFKKLLNSLGVYTEVVKNVEITSTDYSNPGSWHIDKSAIWTGPGKAQITFDLNTIRKSGQIKKNYDVVLVLDVSTSMKGEKIDSLKSSAKKYIDEVLQDADNNVAIVEYHTFATVLSEFTKNKENLSNIIDNLKLKCQGEIIDGVVQNYGYCTNYSDGLAKTEELLSNYKEQDGRQLVVLFLTDGHPNKDTGLIEGQYEVLKDKYPNIIINGIQYEMGSVISYYLQKASDYQYDAYADNIYDIFFKSTYQDTLLNYENFVISDYIENEYFSVNSVDDVTVSRGTVKLEEENGVQKVVWNLGDDFLTGSSAKMDINVELKDNYLGTSKFLPTNKKEEISYKIEGENPKEVKSNKTPVLKHSYEVFYDTNTPTGCSLATIPKEIHYVYETVTKKSNQLTCPGYLFRGWEITDADAKDITIINDDNFIMPEHDVTIRATWSKQTVEKSMSGTVREKVTLYKVLKKEAESGDLAMEYTKVHQDSINGTGKEKIYYYYARNNEQGTAIQNKNNVIFAGMCWQMIRTTDTGGVKMIYNGEPDSNGRCGTNRGEHIGYGEGKIIDLSSNYYYGTSYTYDSSTKKFSLDGTKTSATWNATTGPTLVGKYTCKSTNQYGTCDTLYYVESYQNATSAYILSLNSSANYSTFGTVQFNANDNSLAYAGYMYNKIYTFQYENHVNTNYKYATSFTYSNGTYKLSNGVKNIDLSNLANATQINNAHYTCFSSTDTCTTISYIYQAVVSTSSDNISVYYINLTGGESIEDALNKMLYADDVNTTNSTIKNAIDAWYEKYLLDYSDYLEDTIFCNDRSTRDLAGWNPNGGDIKNNLFFTESSSLNLYCTNVTDRFSVSNNKAKLKYPVGLITAFEKSSLNKYALQNPAFFWLASPGILYPGSPSVVVAREKSYSFHSIVSSDYGLRPVISLTADTEYIDGDGSMDHPYIVELD